MSKGIKLFVGFMLLFVIFGIISSCGGQKSEPTPQSPTPVPEKSASTTTPPEATPTEPPQQQAATPAVPAAQAGKPKIACDEPEYDFGERSNDEKVEHEFIIKNIGDGQLLIDKVRTTCGCTVAQLEKKELQPGESTKIKTTLSLKGRQGATSKSISVESNDPETPLLTLTLKGTAIAPILVEPQVVNLGKIVDDKPADQVIEVKSNRPDLTFNITKVDLSQLPGFKTEVETVEQGKSYKIKLSATESIPPGVSFYNKVLTIETDITPPGESAQQDPAFVSAYQKIKVPISGKSMGPIEISPEVIAFRADNENPGEKNQFIRVSPGREKEFKITEVIPPSPEIKIDINERQPSDYLIHVQNIPADSSMKGKELIIKTTSKSVPEIKIPFRVIELPSMHFKKPEDMKGNPPGNRPMPNLPVGESLNNQPPRPKLPQSEAQPAPAPAPQPK